ncbi:hypothetical protein [Candidatus Halobonum tyrrellensis]|uniref:Uncharacterized protein n=1 Tax=Candidatus Halobonum tyrrellensis G22 TaxID=1324957 RepID=V4HHF5_9EURY|nr:hypothetical protein [Candidatus Halobonum tyrrellensis]ESP90205.1 hypothetical protein K933_00050 [Candidatus Halobonum tyrrellensis G22]
MVDDSPHSPGDDERSDDDAALAGADASADTNANATEDAEFDELLADLRTVLEELSAEVDVDREDVDATDGVVEVVTMVVGVPSRADLSVLLGAAADLTRRVDERVDDPDPPLSGLVTSLTVVLVGVLRELRAALDEESTADSEHVRRLTALADGLEARVGGADLPSPTDALDDLRDALSGSDAPEEFVRGDDVTHIEVEDSN